MRRPVFLGEPLPLALFGALRAQSSFLAAGMHVGNVTGLGHVRPAPVFAMRDGVLQHGGFAHFCRPLIGRPNLKAEFTNEKHKRGTCSAARTANPDSANSQFYVCFGDAPWLDRQYSVWGAKAWTMSTRPKRAANRITAPSAAPDKILKARIESGPA